MDPKSNENQNPVSTNQESKENSRQNGKGKTFPKNGSKKKKDKKGFRSPKNNRQDPFWYAEDEKTIKAIGSIPWNTVIGQPLSDSFTEDVIPGFMAIPYYPALYNDEFDKGSNLARAAEQYFLSINQGISGGYTEFDAPDVFMTAVGGADLIAHMVHLKRVYGIVRYYKGGNMYLPDTILKGLGVMPESLSSGYSLEDFIADYDLRAEQINSLIVVPQDFRLAKRWNYINSWVFSDNTDVARSTLMAYVPAGQLEYNPTGVDTGTSLDFKTYETICTASGRILKPVTIQDWWYRIDQAIASYTGQDQRNMFQAIKKVYSDTELAKVAPLDKAFKSEPVRNDIVALAIHNADYFSDVYPGFRGTEEITAPDNCARYTWMKQFADGSIHCRIFAHRDPGLLTEEKICVVWPEDRIIDSFDSMLTPGQCLDATVNMASEVEEPIYSLTRSGSVAKAFTEVIGRSEILGCPTIYAYSNGTVLGRSFLPTLYTGKMYVVDFLASHINSCPIIWNTVFDTKNGGITFRKVDSYIGEIDDFTIVDKKLLRRINTRCVYDMVKLPESTKSFTK